MKKTNEREIAVDTLMEILLENGYNHIVLRRTLGRHGDLSQVQKAFVTEVVNGTLRQMLLLDYIIGQFSQTPVKKMKPLILNILRVSVYQMRFMDKTPDFAVCNEAVALAKRRGFGPLSGFVNGVLRNILRHMDDVAWPDREKSPVQYFAVRYSYPEWLVALFQKELQDDWDRVEALLEAGNRAPKPTLCVNTLKTDKHTLMEAIVAAGGKASAGKLVPEAVQISGLSDMAALDVYRKGHFHVMDESAMLAVAALGPRAGQTVLDVCAAPGGKSFLTAYRMHNRGHILSRDIHPHKLTLMEQGRDRLGIEIMVVQPGDATECDESLIETADSVLVDAPCSGLGLLRKKPDIKLSKTPEDIRRLAQLQRDILSACWRYVKPGGTLVYSTCTLTTEENLDVVRWFLSQYPFTLMDMGDCLPPGVSFDTAREGYITIWPQDYGTDGFFIARLTRKA